MYTAMCSLAAAFRKEIPLRGRRNEFLRSGLLAFDECSRATSIRGDAESERLPDQGRPVPRCGATTARAAGRQRVTLSGLADTDQYMGSRAKQSALTRPVRQVRELNVMDITIKSLSPGNVVLLAVAAGVAVSVAAAPIAAAEPILPVPGGGPASEAIEQLQSAGYNVSINWLTGHPNVPLLECMVTGISGLPAATTATEPVEFDTVYVDVVCPNAK
jgi:hypothetical protein